MTAGLRRVAKGPRGRSVAGSKALRGLGRSQPPRLVVDRRVHVEELRRFEANVVWGPGADDCAIWAGAIGGDGYGRN